MIGSVEMSGIERMVLAWRDVQADIDLLTTRIAERPSHVEASELDRLHDLADDLICELVALEEQLLHRLLARQPGAVGSYYSEITCPAGPTPRQPLR